MPVQKLYKEFLYRNQKDRKVVTVITVIITPIFSTQKVFPHSHGCCGTQPPS